MNTSEFLIALRAKGIALWRDNDALRYRSPKGTVTDEIRSQLVKRKAEILALLEQASTNSSTLLSLYRDSTPASTDSLSYAEESLWLLDQIRPGSAWNMQSSYRLLGPLRIEALEQSLNEMVKRQDILRTSFKLVAEGPVRIITPSLTVEFPVSTLGPSSDADEEIRRVAATEAKYLFDLSQAPLFRTRLIRIRGQEHVFILTMHHLITDAWSNRILLRELFALYEAFSQGRSSPLQNLTFHYIDYAAWIRTKRMDSHVSYWQSKLARFTISEISPDKQRTATSSSHGAKEQIQLGETLTKELKQLCARERATVFMLMVAAFKILLRRYTGSTDITVGSVVSGRNEPELEHVMGLFVNTIVLRSDLSGEPTFRELLRRVRQVCLEGYEHQDLPLERVVEALKLGGGNNRNPFFQVLFDVNNLQPIHPKVTGLEVEPLTRREDTSRYELVLRTPELGKSIVVLADYNIDLFSRDRIVEMLEQYKVMLEQIAEYPDWNIDSYSLVTPSARTSLPEPTEPLDDTCYGAVHELVSQHARRQPEKIAMEDSQDAWSYLELNERSNQLASYLRSKGIGRQDIVAIYARRNASLIWALVGILKSGAAFCILDPSHPPLRLKDCLNAIKPKGLIHLTSAEMFEGDVENTLREAAPDCYVRLPRLAEARQAEFLSKHPKADPEVRITADDLAYVIFTSGSTGRPKAVMGRHGPLTHFLTWTRDTLALSDRDRFSALAGLSSNILQREIFTGLSLGGTICLPDHNPTGVFSLVDEWIKRNAVTVLHLTVALAQVLDDSFSNPIPSVERVFFAGDLLRWRDIARIRRCVPNAEVINFYASSETQRACGYKIFPIGRSAPKDKDIPPLGRGVKDVQLLVVNASGKMAGIGELGEIWVRSPHLARGYLEDEKLSNERFIVNPFTGIANDRIFRTGEKGRYLPNGEVEYVSRGENQVSIRGFRVELGEIESVLMDHPSVKEAVVAGYGDPTQRLIAYVTPRSGATVGSSELRSYLRTRLPSYMIPTGILVLKALPLTPTGKVDRKSLPDPGTARMELEQTYVSPATLIEKQLAGIWQDVLKIEKLGIHDNFFDLGGHSLAATRVAARVISEFHLELPVSTLFQSPSIAEMAAVITEHLSTKLGEQDLERISTELESLSDEEARRLAAKQPVAVRR